MILLCIISEIHQHSKHKNNYGCYHHNQPRGVCTSKRNLTCALSSKPICCISFNKHSCIIVHLLSLIWQILYVRCHSDGTPHLKQLVTVLKKHKWQAMHSAPVARSSGFLVKDTRLSAKMKQHQTKWGKQMCISLHLFIIRTPAGNFGLKYKVDKLAF